MKGSRPKVKRPEDLVPGLEVAVPTPPAAVVHLSPGTRTLPVLNAFRFTPPVTLADLGAAFDALRVAAPDALIEVNSVLATEVVIDVRWPDQRIRRTFIVS